MATISNTPRPGYVWDSTDNVWYPIGVGAHQHTNAADTPAVMPYSTYAAAGKNKILNGDFNINQRAFTSTTTSATYGFDRWSQTIAGDGTATYSAQTFTLGSAPVSGYEGKNFARFVTSGQTSAAVRTNWIQAIENVRTLAGQTATVSFWAKAATGTPQMSIELTQYFGAGGSPSSTVIIDGGRVALSTSWARYSVTVSIPSLSGKTLGTDGADTLGLLLWVSAGSNFASRTGTLGIQNNTFDIWGVQVEAGSNATAFQTATGNPASELAACQRYYFRTSNDSAFAQFGAGVATATDGALIFMQMPVTMRVAPTAVEWSNLRTVDGPNDYGAVSAIAINTYGNNRNITALNVSDTGYTVYRPMYLQANNNAGAYLAVTAEL